MPAPACLAPSPARMIYVDDCAQAYFPDDSCQPTASYRSMVCPEAGQTAASSTTCNQRPAGASSVEEEEEERKFNLNLRRMVSRAEAQRVTRMQHHHHH